MDVILGRQRRGQERVLTQKSATKNVNIMAEMERDFTQIFGSSGEGEFSSEAEKRTDAAAALRCSALRKAPMKYWAKELD